MIEKYKYWSLTNSINKPNRTTTAKKIYSWALSWGVFHSNHVRVFSLGILLFSICYNSIELSHCLNMDSEWSFGNCFHLHSSTLWHLLNNDDNLIEFDYCLYEHDNQCDRLSKIVFVSFSIKFVDDDDKTLKIDWNFLLYLRLHLSCAQTKYLISNSFCSSTKNEIIFFCSFFNNENTNTFIDLSCVCQW